MILNENDSRAISSSKFTIDQISDTKESHLYFLCFKMPSYEMLPLILMGVEMIVFENSVLKMYLLNTHLSFYRNSFHFVYLFHRTICRKYMIKRLIHDFSHSILAIIPRLCLGLIWGSQDYTWGDMEKVMY